MTEEKTNDTLKLELLETQIRDVTAEFESLKHLNLEYLKTNNRLNTEIKNIKELSEQQIILNDTMIDKHKEIFKGSKRNLFWIVSIFALAAILLSFQLIDKRIDEQVVTKINTSIEKINHIVDTSAKSLAVSKNLQNESQNFINKHTLLQKQQEAELKNAQTQFQDILTHFKNNTDKTNEAISEIKINYLLALNNFKTMLNKKSEETKTLKVEVLKELTKISQNNAEIDILKSKSQKELASLQTKYQKEIKNIQKIQKEIIKQSIPTKIIAKEKRVTPKKVTSKKPVTKKKSETADSLIQKARKLQKKYYYTQAIKIYQQAIKLDPKKEIGYYNLGMLYANKKQYSNAILSYKKSLKLNPNRSLSFTNLFEMQLITNKNFNSDILKMYKKQNENNKKSLIKYEMIDIFKDIKNRKNIDKKLHAWNKNYQNVSLGNWSFKMMKHWINKEKDSTTKGNLNLVLKTFEAHI